MTGSSAPRVDSALRRRSLIDYESCRFCGWKDFQYEVEALELLIPESFAA